MVTYSGAARLAAAALLLLALAACTPLAPAPADDLSWRQHRDRVLAQDSWRLSGRLNIRAPEQSNTVNLRWRQSPDDFEINLSGTLGFGAVRISGNEQLVRIEQAGEEPVFADSLSAMSADYLGYEFPAGRLYYWLRGVTAPGDNENIELNDERRLAALEQGSWRLTYDRYRQVGDLALPGRIRLTHDDYRLTFLIHDWTLEPS